MIGTKSLQVKEYIRNKIGAGEFRPHDSIPSVNDLSKKFAVNRNTAVKVLNELAAAGEIYQVRGVGSFVAATQERIRSYNLGVLVYNIASPVYSKIIRHLADSCREQNYNVIPISLYGRREIEWQTIATLTEQHKIDGLVIFPSSEAEEEFQHLEKVDAAGVPVLAFHVNGGAKRISTMGFDHFAGLKKVVGHLIQQGYRRIGLVTRRYQSADVMQRLYGYRAGLEEAGLKFRDDYVFSVDEVEERYGYEAADVIVDRQDRPEALVVITDEVAVGLINRLAERGMKVPGDLAIVGGGNIDLGVHPSYSLSTIAPDFAVMGRQMVEHLLHRIDHPELPGMYLTFPENLIIRNSSANIKALK